jgi:hypothetical protein
MRLQGKWKSWLGNVVSVYILFFPLLLFIFLKELNQTLLHKATHMHRRENQFFIGKVYYIFMAWCVTAINFKIAGINSFRFFMTYKGLLMVTDDLLLQGLRNASRLVPLVWFMQRMVMLLPRDNNG